MSEGQNPGAPGASIPIRDVPVGLAPHTRRCPPAGGPEAEEASRVARPGPASPFPAGPRPIPSPSASARAKECGEAGWAAGTPGFALLIVHEHWGQMRELPPRDPGRGEKDILELGSASGTSQRKSSGRWPFEDFSLSCHLRQNSLPSLVRFLGNQGEWVRVTWLMWEDF